MARTYLILPLFCVSCMVVKPLDPKFDKMHISVHILPLNQVAAKCKMGPVNGCARVLSNSCTIYSIKDTCVLMHEYKHCLGWNHPEGYTDCR